MKIFYHRLFALPVYFLIAQLSVAQTTAIPGKIIAEDKQTPPEAVVISVKGQKKVAVSDKYADFNINFVQTNTTSVTSCTG